MNRAPDQERSLAEVVWRAVVYFDLLDHALTGYELWQILEPCQVKDPSLQQVQAEVRGSLADRLVEQSDFVVRRGREQLIARRHQSARVTAKLWTRVQRMCRVMRWLPFVRMVAVSGTLARDAVSASSDIDLFITIEHKRLWIGRLLTKLLTMSVGLHRHDRVTQGRFCLNHYVSTAGLELDHHNLYVARLFSQLTVVYGRANYQRFLEANGWMQSYIPRAPLYRFPPFGVLEDQGVGKWVKCGVEWLLGGWLGDQLERLVRQRQLRHIEADPRRLEPTAQVVTTDRCLRFHLEAQEPVVLQRFQEAVAEGR